VHVCAYGMVHELSMNFELVIFGIENVVIKAWNKSYGYICMVAQMICAFHMKYWLSCLLHCVV